MTEADLAIDAELRRILQSDGEGWLSEESADDTSRLDKKLVWIVDPLDGTREFIHELPDQPTAQPMNCFAYFLRLVDDR